MSGNHPNNFSTEQDFPDRRIISGVESELIFSRVERIWDSDLLDDAGEPEYAFGDYDGKKYRPQDVEEYIAKFER